MKSRGKVRMAVFGIALMLGMLPHASSADGQTLEELSAQWWQWALSIPTPDNPLNDPTVSKCAMGQQGPVWWIPVASSGTGACTIPDTKALFFPTLSYIFFDTPNICGQGASVPVPEMRALAAAYVDGITAQSIDLDGQPVVGLRRVQSPVFQVVLPEDNYFDANCTNLGGSPGGTFSPSITDGYFVMLNPLRPGACWRVNILS